jgi:hypothetical protein
MRRPGTAVVAWLAVVVDVSCFDAPQPLTASAQTSTGTTHRIA